MSKLILLRHGQSLWNKKNIFTGWVDVPLSEIGINEALNAGIQLKDISIDKVYTSVQIRAIQTALLVLSKNNYGKTPVIIHSKGKMSKWAVIYDEKTKADIIPVIKDWHLNERYYGKLQGKNKTHIAKVYGKELVHQWRRSYDISPPRGECLRDTSKRTIPFFRSKIIDNLKDCKDILVSAHGNSLRSIIMYIEKLSKKEVLELEISTGKPIIYNYNNGKLIKSELF